MRYYLPYIKTGAKFLFSLSKIKIQEIFGSKQSKYRLAAILDLLLILMILTHVKQPAQRLITPYVSSLQTIYTNFTARLTPETFAFAPDLAPNKFPYIDLEGLAYLSFFDVPLTEEGELNFYSKGYSSFTSDRTSELFERARYNNTKIMLTLTATSPQLIANLLDNPWAQENLANQAIEEVRYANINGITIDFEYPGEWGQEYSGKFTDFIKYLTSRFHNELPDTQVAVALPNCHLKKPSIYNTEQLSQAADKLFLVASDFIVPEVQNSNPTNPVFGFAASDYWQMISAALDKFKNNQNSQLVMERAWYGNGNNYPLYNPSRPSDNTTYAQNYPIQLDQYTLERLVAGVPQKGQEAARKNIPLIVQALQNEGILDSNVLAYALATVEHETDETFEPIEEIGGRFSARRYGYEGGTNYFGRGFIQITHLRNYRAIGERIGMGEQLAKNPELASEPVTAARILAAFFKDNNVANLASQGSFVAARTPINPDYNGYTIANLALKYGLY